jgi:hypothetical protein
MHQLLDFVCCSFTFRCRRRVDCGDEVIIPSVPALSFRSTRNQSGSCTPLLATVRLYSIFQLLDFVCCLFTHLCRHPVDVASLYVIPSILTLFSRSTRNQSGDCSPISMLVLLAELLLGGSRTVTALVSQLCIFFYCPEKTSCLSRPSIRSRIRQGTCICICIIIISGRRRRKTR